MNTSLSITSLLALFGFDRQVPGKQMPLPTVPQVDLRRYSGRWYEIARLPNWFQKHDERAIAEYLPTADGPVIVLNTAIAENGRTRVAVGKAMPVEGSGGARLRVKFSGLAGLVPVSKEGNYWIIALDDEYRNAMVGTPDRKFLWILAREKTLDPKTAESLASQARRQGFDTEKLHWDTASK